MDMKLAIASSTEPERINFGEDQKIQDRHNSTTHNTSRSRKKRVHLDNDSESSVEDQRKRKMPLNEKQSAGPSADDNAHSGQSPPELTNQCSDFSGDEKNKSLTSKNVVSDNNPTSNNTWIFFNVRGTLFQTTKDTILQQPGSFLDRFVNDYFPCEKDETGAYIIDRDPEHFYTILNYFRNPVLTLDCNKKVMKELFREAEFYNVHSLVREIQKRVMKDLLRKANFFKIEPLIEDIEKNMSTMIINVICKNSEIGMVRLAVEKDYTVSTVKAMINELDGIPPYQQRLFSEESVSKMERLYHATTYKMAQL